MANKEQQIRHSFLYLLPVIVSNLLPFVTLPIFTRILTQEDYGILALAQIYAIFLTGLANFGMPATYNRNYFQYSNDSRKAAQLLFSTLLFITLNFLVFVLITYFFRETLAKAVIGQAQHGNILFWAFCAQFFNGITYYYYTYFKNSEMAKNFVSYTIAGSLIYFFMALFMVAYLRIGVIGIIYAQLLSGTIIFGILSYKFVTMLPFSLNKAILFESLKISYRLTPNIFLGVINSQFDKYMIGLIASVGGVGIYAIAQKVATVTFTYMTSLQNVFSPQVYKKMFNVKEDGGQAIGTYLTPFLYISIACALMIALFSEEIVHLLMPVSYHGATDIVIIFSMYYGILFFGKITPMQLIFMKKTHICTMLFILNLFLNIALNIPFIMKWGAIGAAFATLLAGLISGSISMVVAHGYFKVHYEWNKIGWIMGVFLVSSIAILSMSLMSTPYFASLMVKIIAMAVFLALGIRYEILTKENYREVRSALRTKKYSTTNLFEKCNPCK